MDFSTRCRPAAAGHRASIPLAATLCCACMLGTTAALLPASATAQSWVQQQTRSFDIPAGPLGTALSAFIRQSGVFLAGTTDMAEGRRSPGVRGEYTVDEALRRLLDGTGLRYSFVGDDTVRLDHGDPGGAAQPALDPLLITARRPRGAGSSGADGAGSIEINRGDIERRNPATVKDVFAGESSVSVGGAIPIAQKIYVNGVEESNLAVSIDGARQNNRVFHHTGINVLDPRLLKRARVDAGVAPADAGPGALGGALVYETVDAGDLLPPDRNAGAFLSGGYTGNGSTYRTGASVFGRSNGVEALGFVQRAEGNDYRDGDSDTVAGTGADLLSLLGKLAYEGGGHRVGLSVEQVRDHANRPYRANVGSVIGRPEPEVRRYELTRRNATLNYGMPGASGWWDPTLTIGYGLTELEVPEPWGSEGETGSLSARLGNTFHLSADDSISLGTDFYRDKATYQDPDTDEVSEQATNTGVYAQARLRPWQPLEVSTGVRSDWQTFEGLDGTEMRNHGWSGNLSLLYHVTDSVRLNAGYSDVWGGIKLAENYIFNPAWDYDDIDPVRARNTTLGFDVDRGPFSLDGRVFRSDFSNAREPSFGGGPSETVDFRSEGYTVGTRLRWRQGFVRLSYTDSRITVNGDAASSYATRSHGAPLGRVIALEAMHWLDGPDIGFGGTIDASLRNTRTRDAGGLPQEAYEVVGLYMEYRPRQRYLRDLSLRAEVNNVFDETYADRATYGQDFDTIEPLNEPGRSFGLSVRMDL